jgi:prepilin-type N-terminal cleavage/methylation domain-containing protein
MNDEKGVSLVELLVTLAIFSVVMAGVYAIYLAQIRHSTREYMLAESEMEIEIAKNIIERDIMMAGYGIADDYGPLSVDPLPVGSTDAASPASSDSLILRGTGVGILSRSTMAWSYITSKGPPVRFHTWSDGRENVIPGDRVIYITPNIRKILTDGSKAVFTFPDFPPSAEEGTVVYGLNSDDANLPYYTVQYLTGGAAFSMCSSGTRNLLRAESRNDDPPPSSSRESILNCVRDFQVAIGLDTNDDGIIDLWDNGETLPSYNRQTLRRRLKQVRLYVLLQQGNRDPYFTYSNPDNPGDGATIRVGDSGLGTGRDITLTAEQRRYRWRVLTLSVTPRNLR